MAFLFHAFRFPVSENIYDVRFFRTEVIEDKTCSIFLKIIFKVNSTYTSLRNATLTNAKSGRRIIFEHC